MYYVDGYRCLMSWVVTLGCSRYILNVKGCISSYGLHILEIKWERNLIHLCVCVHRLK